MIKPKCSNCRDTGITRMLKLCNCDAAKHLATHHTGTTLIQQRHPVLFGKNARKRRLGQDIGPDSGAALDAVRERYVREAIDSIEGGDGDVHEGEPDPTVDWASRSVEAAGLEGAPEVRMPEANENG